MRRQAIVASAGGVLVSISAWADLLPVVKPEAVGLSAGRLERRAAAIRHDVDTGRIPGAAVAIARRGKLAYYEAFGFSDPVAHTPMPKDAIYRQLVKYLVLPALVE